MIDMCFRLVGRINRKTWWKAQGMLLAAAGVLVGAATLIGESLPFPSVKGLGASELPVMTFVAFWLMFYPAFAVNVKRAHDRNRSAFYVGIISMLVVLLFSLQVTAMAGPHKFGLLQLLVIWLFSLRHVDGGTWPSGRNGRPQWLWRRASESRYQ
jgi:uncharacterized membrane protein YhaH (DUF805 family)